MPSLGKITVSSDRRVNHSWFSSLWSYLEIAHIGVTSLQVTRPYFSIGWSSRA